MTLRMTAFYLMLNWYDVFSKRRPHLKFENIGKMLKFLRMKLDRLLQYDLICFKIGHTNFNRNVFCKQRQIRGIVDRLSRDKSPFHAAMGRGF